MHTDERDITEIMEEKLAQDGSFTEFLHDHSESFIQINLASSLQTLIKRQRAIKNRVIRDSGINRRYFYDILSGKRQPTRDYILRILIALGLPFGDIQWLLKATGYPQLYPRDRRDCVLIYCINHGIGVQECNRMLRKVYMEAL